MPVTVTASDAGYATLLSKWQDEGSPNGTFERLGDHGGELWRVGEDEDGATMFLLRAAAGPTDPGYDYDPEAWRWGEQKTGYLVEMYIAGGLEVTEGAMDNDLQIDIEEMPLDETVWSP